jgi:CBS domain-containing protein
MGLVTEARIRRSLAENGKQSIGQLADQTPSVSPDDPLIRAVMRMNETNTRQMPVIPRLDHARIVRLLSMTDVVRAQALTAKDAGAFDRTASPEFAEERETLDA